MASDRSEMARHQGLMGLLSLCVLTSAPLVARADDVKDDVKKDSHDAKRSVKKAGHRINEAACTGSKAECEARKGKHRVEETGDKAGDKMSEGSDKLKEDVQ